MILTRASFFGFVLLDFSSALGQMLDELWQTIYELDILEALSRFATAIFDLITNH